MKKDKKRKKGKKKNQVRQAELPRMGKPKTGRIDWNTIMNSPPTEV